MIQLEVTEKERKLIERLRKIPYGDITIVMHQGKPVRILKGVEKEEL